MNGLELKTTKTLVTQISVSAFKHKSLPSISCEPPATVTTMRWFIEPLNVLLCCTRFSKYFNDLEAAVFYKNKNDKIRWIDSILESFKTAQNAPKLPSATVISTPSGQFIIFHDGCSVENRLN